MTLLESLNWRYATKKMNGQPVPQEKVDNILEAAMLAPSSSGLQPFRVIVITDQKLKEQIRAISFDQSQVTDGSHLLVFAAWDNYTKERISDVFAHTAQERGLPADTFDDYKQRLFSIYLDRPAQVNFEHAARQAYISFGMAIAAAAELKVDATPMEGFDNEKLDELLDLKSQGLKSVTLLPLGYRDESKDWLVNQKKVRIPKDEFVQTIG
jgi:nitroreductase/dihydropteridine reductase